MTRGEEGHWNNTKEKMNPVATSCQQPVREVAKVINIRAKRLSRGFQPRKVGKKCYDGVRPFITK